MVSAIIKPRFRGATAQWLKRAGVAGFAFFLAKGLLWLGIAAAAAWRGFGNW